MTERIDGIIDRVSNEEHFSDIEWILKAPVENIAWSVVDDTMRANAEFQYKAGLPAKVVRKTEASGIRTVKRGNKTISYRVPCKWCQRLAGTYTYPNVPRDVWKRHDGCECIIEYTPAGGGPAERLSGVKDLNGKRWYTEQTELETRQKYFGIDTKPALSANEQAEQLLKEIYDEHMRVENLNLVPVDQAKLDVDLSALPPKIQDAYVKALQDLKDGEFTSTLTGIRPKYGMDPRIGAETGTTALGAVSSMDYNPAFSGLKPGPQKRMLEKGWIPRIDPERIDEYVATHEIGHTIFDPNVWNVKETFTGADLPKYKQARKEINRIYDSYIKKVSELETKYRQMTVLIESGDDSVDLIEYMQIGQELADTKISQYSLTNPAEMVAEAYVEYMLGTKQTETTREIINVLRKYFGK